MKKILKSIACFTFALAAFALFQTHACASPAFTLDPVGGNVSGFAGQTVGWGFTLKNNTDFILIVSSSEFQPSLNSIGTFTDFMGPEFIELDPGASLTQAFDFSSQLGVGSFAIDGGVSVPSSIVGRILVTYDLFTEDFDQVAFSQILSADASVSALPEPLSIILIGPGLAALAGIRKMLV